MSDAGETHAEIKRGSVYYERPKVTKASVLWADSLAKYAITIGGMLVIIAVFTIMVFLFYVASPLLNPGSVSSEVSYDVPTSETPYVLSQMDEHQTIGVNLEANGVLKAFHVGTGKELRAPAYDLGGLTSTAFASTLRGDDVLFGFADGTVRIGRLELAAQIVPTAGVPQGLSKLDARDATDGTSVFSQIPGQARKTTVGVKLDAPIQVAPAGTAIVRADYRLSGTAERPLKTFVTLDATNHLRLSQAYSQVNMMTGEAVTDVTNAEIPVEAAADQITGLLLNSLGDRVIVATRDGTLYRYNTRDFKNPRLAEKVKVTPDGVSLSAVAYMNGETSIIVGGSDGSVSIWFPVEAARENGGDGLKLIKVHANFIKQPSAITDIRSSQRTRMFSTADATGHVWLRHGTTERTLLELPGTPDASGVQLTVFAPKEDGILAIGKNFHATLWGIYVPHPETTLQSLFGKVWYEGYSEPAYVWQSTASTDSPEPKLSLIPLIFGTFKAAVYSLMLAIPIALFAAIYTSEFVNPNTRSVIKPTMELMATLPSVVVGFVAALVLSPIVENWIAAIVISFAVIPLSLITAAFLWQLLPTPVATMLDGLPKLFAYFLVVLAAVWLSSQAGPLMETLFFDGDFKKWTAGGGSGQPFLFLILLPASFFVVFLATRPIFGQVYRMRLRGMTVGHAATREVTTWIVFVGLSLVVAWLGSMSLAATGIDARGGVVDTYVQRNALVAAFAIAFAEIPIIYTISEDALNAVPSYLRSGSLACGASRWQTASWVVLPTAASGIFSAIMIGLGRAVGETMIVLMSTGNTPIMDYNVFNGLRTLSANINVELPEAVRDSTLYRTLFLCALTLFVMTFVINTIAELVRQRYRKRAAQL